MSAYWLSLNADEILLSILLLWSIIAILILLYVEPRIVLTVWALMLGGVAIWAIIVDAVL